MHDDVGSPFERTDQIRGRNRVIHDQGDAVRVGYPANALDIENIIFGVRDDLTKKSLGLGTDRCFPLSQIMGIVHKGDLDSHLGHRVVQQVIGAAVQRRGGHHMATGLSEGQDCERGGGLTRTHCEGSGQTDRGDASTL